MKRRAPVLDYEALASEIASLSKASITDLRERWKAMHGKAPSRDIGRSFLTRAIARAFSRPGSGPGFGDNAFCSDWLVERGGIRTCGVARNLCEGKPTRLLEKFRVKVR
jgi:hypothetical protein